MPSLSAAVRVDKATSDLLTGPDWAMNMDICDSVNSDRGHAKDAVKAVKKRLQHKNPKVQILALVLLEMMIKNCGDYLHFQVVERDILQEMMKIVRKKADVQVRDKILVLLDSWQEAFDGPGGKYPQYYWAYVGLRRSGVEFPQRSGVAAPVLTTFVHPTPRQAPEGYGMPSSSYIRHEEAMASEMGNLSISDLDSIQRVVELLNDMLLAVDTYDSVAVKDDVIVDIVGHCRSNQKKLMHMLSSTGDEELLAKGLMLNDTLQSLLAKHDTIASGCPLPAEASSSVPRPSMPTMPVTTVRKHVEDEEEEEDEFNQLARRNSKAKVVTSPSGSVDTDDHEISSDHTIATTASLVTMPTESSSSAQGHALALLDPPPPVRTSVKEQDMIDLLSITSASEVSTTCPPRAPPSASNSSVSHVPDSPNALGYPYNLQHCPGNQKYIPYNGYVVPWARLIPIQFQPQHQPQTQPKIEPHFHPEPPQFSLFPSSHPPPPCASSPSVASYNSLAASQANSMAAYMSTHSSRPLQQFYSFSPRGSNVPTIGETLVNANPRRAVAEATAKPFVPSYRLFEDLMDLRNLGGRSRIGGMAQSLPGSSNQNVASGRK